MGSGLLSPAGWAAAKTDDASRDDRLERIRAYTRDGCYALSRRDFEWLMREAAVAECADRVEALEGLLAESEDFIGSLPDHLQRDHGGLELKRRIDRAVHRAQPREARCG